MSVQIRNLKVSAEQLLNVYISRHPHTKGMIFYGIPVCFSEIIPKGMRNLRELYVLEPQSMTGCRTPKQCGKDGKEAYEKCALLLAEKVKANIISLTGELNAKLASIGGSNLALTHTIENVTEMSLQSSSIAGGVVICCDF